MLMKKKLLLLLVLLPVFILFIQPTRTFGQDLPPGMVVGDENGIHATKEGEFFVEITDVVPGKSWHKAISLLNMEKDVPYQLTMLISPPKVSGNLDLSEAIQMKLTYQDKVVYNGPASGISKDINLQNKPLDLGVFNSGDSRALLVDYSISGKYTNKDFDVKNTMRNTWTFYAVKTKKTTPKEKENPNEPSKAKLFGRLPMTGETVRQMMIILCIAMLIILICLLIWKKRKINTNEGGDKG